MTTQELILLGVVAVVGIPSAWRNPTAAALVLAYIFSKVLYLATGNGLAVEFYLYPDMFVLAIIFCKPDYQPCDYYRSIKHQLACVLLERSPADRIVMLVFPLMWVLYFAPLDAFYVWQGLWALSIIQFLAAGVESFATYRRSADAANSLPGPPGELLVATGGGGYG